MAITNYPCAQAENRTCCSNNLFVRAFTYVCVATNKMKLEKESRFTGKSCRKQTTPICRHHRQNHLPNKHSKLNQN